jgi:mono/diheme cytochrome c family protein
MGHRNIQGLVYGTNGTLYSSEHGDAIEDELNIIKKAGNYGWPNVEGFCSTEEEKAFCAGKQVMEPLRAWTPVVAPAGMDYYASDAIPEWKNSILLTTLKTESLRVLKLNGTGDKVLSESIYLDHQFGRLRDLCVSPAGDVYVATSNRDWNPGEGYPKKGDDRIVRIFKTVKPKVAAVRRPAPSAAGALIYKNYCESCHKTAGQGVAGVFPPLRSATQVTGDKNALIRILLKGMSGPIIVKGVKYDQDMPAFSFLSDKDLALVATYIRTQFGNKATAINTAEVSRIRSVK